MAEYKSNMFWAVYKKLEKNVVDLSYYIHFSDANNGDKHNQIWTYSNQIADLLIAISIQIESLFLELYNTEFDVPTDSIGAAIKEINGKWRLDEKTVRIICKNMYFTDKNGFGKEFAPMNYKAGDNNDYYSSYCAVKHNRINALNKANINVLVRALAALYILNIYYSFECVGIDKVSEFDFSLGSEVFMVEHLTNNSSPKAILIVKEDVDYLKKIDSYLEILKYDYNDDVLKFNDEITEPKRFTVELNKDS